MSTANMQTGRRELLRQQALLKDMGFYNGRMDGIWGPATIKAMQKFEAARNVFKPALASNGFPLPTRGPLPKFFYVDKGLITSPNFERNTAIKAEEEAAWKAIEKQPSHRSLAAESTTEAQEVSTGTEQEQETAVDVTVVERSGSTAQVSRKSK